MGHEQHVARITTNPEACITILLQKATGFWQVVVSMYNIADFKFRTVATQYKSSSTTGTGS